MADTFLDHDDLLKIYADDINRAPKMVGNIQDVGITGNIGAKNVLGTYSVVISRFQAPAAKPLPDNSYVIGDTASHIYEFLPTGDFTIDPEGDTYNGFGVSDNWIDITFREWLTTAIANKTPFLWNPDISSQLSHPVSMFGSDGQLYNSVAGGDLNDNPTSGNTDNWLLLLDPSTGLIFPGFVTASLVDSVANGYLPLEGGYYSKVLYPNLYTHYVDGTGSCIYGETGIIGDPANGDFKVPDARGRTFRGIDNGSGRDAGAQPKVFSASRTNGSVTLTGISSFNNLEAGALIIGDGIQVGTTISEVDVDADEITMSIAAISTGLGAITQHSRKDRGDGSIPAVYDDNVGTVQEDTYLNHTHRYLREFVAAAFAGGTDVRPNTPTGQDTALSTTGGSNETRMKNIAVRYIVKT